MLRIFRTQFALLFLASALFAQKPFQNGQAARAVVGQLTFTQGNQNPTAQILGGASGLAWANNRLYVADSNRVAASPIDHRVLVFDTSRIPGPYSDVTTAPYVSDLTSCYLCGTSAILTLGQDTFSPPTYTPSGQSASVTAFYNGVNGGQDPAGSSPAEHAWFYSPTAVATDGVRLAVADTDNNRVLLWNSPPSSNNQPPDLVLGQPDFATIQKQALGVVTATTMRGPQGVWIKNNKLYVADTQNHRVLIWNAFPASNNKAPDVVLGQPNFTSANAPPPNKIAPAAAANQLLNPVAVTADNTHIFIADLGFNRVLIWNTTAPSIDQNADVVVGQTDFVSSAANNTNICPTVSTASSTNGPCQYGLNYPRFALSDGSRLFIADGGNDRVLIYNSIPTKNGAAANNVLGQTTFTNDIITSQAISIVSTQIDNTGAVDTTPTPTSLAYDPANQDLYVADPYNRRVLIFTPGDSLLPSASDPNAAVVPVVNWASEIVRQEGTVVLTQVSGGRITANDTVTVTVQGKAYTYTEKSTDNVDGIAKALVRLIAGIDSNVTATFAGNGTGALYLSSLNTNLGYATITLAATTSNTANLLATASGAYLTAGNAATASPGALVEVNAPPGVSFTDNPLTLVPPLTGNHAPNTLGGVQLYLDGFASPLYKVSPTQLVGQIPYAYTDRNSTSVYVRTVHNDGSKTITNATPVYIAPANPGIFNAPLFADQKRPWPIAMARHQAGKPTVVVSVDGSVKASDTATITIAGASYTYTVLSTDTLATIVAGLVKLINATDTNVTASQGGAFTRVVLTAVQSAFAGGNGIAVSTSVSSSANVTLTAYTSSTCCAVKSNSLIYAGNPAVPGELISISGAGLGGIQDSAGNNITPNQVTGAAYGGPAPPLNDVLTANFVAATMGSRTSQVIFAGFDTGSYGIYRLDLLVPSDLPADDTTPLYIAQNAFISNTVTIPVGPAVANPPDPPQPVVASPIRIAIDSPQASTTLSGVVSVQGWVADSSAAISNVSVQVDGVAYGTATYGVRRTDVCAAFPGSRGCPNVGYTYSLDTFTVPNGSHTIQVAATDSAGNNFVAAIPNVSVFNDPAASPTRVAIDSPAYNRIYHGVTAFNGWAINNTSPIVSVSGLLDGIPVTLTYGVQRGDVCAAYPGRPGCPNVGWTYLADLTQLSNSSALLPSVQHPNGAHTFTATAIAANGQKFSASTTFYVNNFSNVDLNSGPVVTIDLPSISAGTLSGTANVSGWVVDAFSTIGSAQISVDGVIQGPATVGVVRNDVCNLTLYSGFPGCPNVGFAGALDTTLIADGAHVLGITVNPREGQSYTVTRAITVGNLNSAANPVRVAIDSPSSQPTFSGTAALFGWSLGETAAVQTVTISVDGVMNGTAAYGVSRGDVCAAFPGRAGCPNVGWSYALDTTRLTAGIHMLEVTSTTVNGKRATASAPFNVRNGPSATRVGIDSPSYANNPYAGIAFFNGWAVNGSSAIASVQVTVDGVYNGSAIYGGARSDVCGVFSGPGCPNVGWNYSLDTTPLVDGAHVLGVTATASDGTSYTASASFTVANWSAVASPFSGSIDLPGGSIKVPYTGTIQTYGWIYEPNVRIAAVLVSVDGIPFGNANIRVSRSDVCTSASVSPDCPNVGWAFTLDTKFLTTDLHTLTVTATTAGGQNVTMTRQFSTAN